MNRPLNSELKGVAGADDLLLSLFVFTAADVEPVDGHDDITGLKSKGFTQGSEIDLKAKYFFLSNKNLIHSEIKFKQNQARK